MLWVCFWTIAAITRAAVSSVAAHVVGTESLRERMTKSAGKGGERGGDSSALRLIERVVKHHPTDVSSLRFKNQQPRAPSFAESSWWSDLAFKPTTAETRTDLLFMKLWM